MPIDAITTMVITRPTQAARTGKILPRSGGRPDVPSPITAADATSGATPSEGPPRWRQPSPGSLEGRRGVACRRGYRACRIDERCRIDRHGAGRRFGGFRAQGYEAPAAPD